MLLPFGGSMLESAGQGLFRWMVDLFEESSQVIPLVRPIIESSKKRDEELPQE